MPATVAQWLADDGVRTLRRSVVTLMAIAGTIAAGAGSALAQSDDAAAASARESAPVDLTGTWVSVAFEDWKFRMVTPDRGVFDGIPLNDEGQRVGNAWDPDSDAISDDACKAYGAPAIMRMPGRFRISWADDDTLRIETDQGEQTRLLHFAENSPGAPSRQGYSIAEWLPGPRGGGSLKVTTGNLLAGYIRKNGAPYSELTEMIEYFNVHMLPNGDVYVTITTRVEDPRYFSGPDIKTTDLRKLPDAEGWAPAPCSVP